jgi:23S rRNA (pseudouridine1915-N3)-methyltransferase
MIRILAVGKIKDRRLAELTADYGRRILRMTAFEVIEVRDSAPAREGQDLLARLGSTSGHEQVVVMAEDGAETTSAELARLLGAHGTVAFIIGGPDGLDRSVRERADRALKLSALTLTHEMARLILTEQIYRALTILRNQPYHRA